MYLHNVHWFIHNKTYITHTHTYFLLINHVLIHTVCIPFPLHCSLTCVTTLPGQHWPRPLCVPVFCLFLADGLGCWDGEFLTDWQKVLEWYKKALVSDGLPLSIIYFLFLFASKHLELAWPNYDLWANTYADNTQCLCLKLWEGSVVYKFVFF